MTYAADPRVDAYIDALPDWQQAICREVRDLVHAADREVAETIKRTNRPYFVLEGNICALLAARDHVNVFLYDGAIVPDPAGIITGGHENKSARTVSIRQGERQQPRGRLAQAEARGWVRRMMSSTAAPRKPCRRAMGTEGLELRLAISGQ